MLTLWHLSVVRQAWDVVGGRGGLWKQLLAEVSELGRRRAHGEHGTCSETRAHGMRTCSHAARTLGCCWTLMTQDNKHSLCPCSQCQALLFFFKNFILYKQIRTFILHSLFGNQSFKSVLYVYVRTDWSPWPSNAYINTIFEGKVSLITTGNNEHSFFPWKEVCVYRNAYINLVAVIVFLISILLNYTHPKNTFTQKYCWTQ